MEPLPSINPDSLLSPKIPSELSGVDEFTQKTLLLHNLATQFKEAKEAESLCRLFLAMTNELSSIFETTLQVKNYRIAIQTALSPTDRSAMEIAELMLQHKRAAHAQTIIQYIGSVVEKVLSRRRDECKSFSTEACRWLCRIQPRRTLQLKYAASLLSAGYVSEAREILSALSPFFPKEVAENLPPEQGLALFARKYGAQIRDSLALVDQEPCGLNDILQNGPTMASLVRHLSSKDLRALRRAVPNWAELTSRSFPMEYFQSRAERILTTPCFSLACAPPVCLNLDRVAFYAVFRDAFQYDYLSEELKRHPLVIRLAILSVFRDCRKRLGEFLRKVPSSVGGLISFAHRIAKKIRSWDALNAERKAGFPPFTYLCPHNEAICEFMLQIHGRDLHWTGPEIQHNERFVLIAVRQDGMAVQDAAEEMRDRDVVAEEGVLKNPWAFGLISKRLQADPRLRRLSGRGSD